MKKIKSHLWKGALCLLAAAFIVTLLLSGHGLRLHEPEPLASQTASIRPEGQGAEPIEDSSEPEETEPTEDKPRGKRRNDKGNADAAGAKPAAEPAAGNA